MKEGTKCRKMHFYSRLVLLLSIVCLIVSCNFVGEEIRQDRHLAYYRYQMHLIPDSLEAGKKRIEAYRSISGDASNDVNLISSRKKNKLLSEIYCFIGSEYFEQNVLKEALENSTLAISLNKTNQIAYYNRGCIYQQLGKDSLAIDDYTSAILYNEDFVEPYYNRGLIYEKRTDFQLAVEDYSKAIMLNPPFVAEAYNNRGNIYQMMGFYDRAIEDYDMALQKDSTMTILYCNRADAYLQKEELDKAIADYAKAQSMDSVGSVLVDHIKGIQKKIQEKTKQLSEKRS